MKAPRLFTALCALICAIPTFARADTDLLIAVEQAMLTQKMAKASCFMATFSDVDKHVGILKDSLERYDTLHQRLLIEENDAQRIARLVELSPTWRLTKFAGLLTLETPNTPGLDIDMMGQFSNELLAHHKKIIHDIIKTPSDNKPYQATLYVIARLGLLLQKATKEFCYISYGFDQEQHRQSLKADINLFDRSLVALLEGDLDNNIIKAPTPELESKINQMRSQWLVIRKKLLPVADGRQALSGDFSIISRINEGLLHQSEDMAMLFSQAYKDFKSAEPSEKEKKPS